VPSAHGQKLWIGGKEVTGLGLSSTEWIREEPRMPDMPNIPKMPSFDAGQLDQLRGEIRSTWNQVTDDELNHARGNPQELISTIEQKTGQSGEEIQRKLTELVAHVR
jgi:uncharacterized protein YjbJ (UPF0337 family)